MTFLGLLFSFLALVGFQVAFYRRQLARVRGEHLISHVPSLRNAWLLCVVAQSAFGDFGIFVFHAVSLTVFSYGYYHFLNMCRTARRIRLLTELIEAGGQIAEAELMRRYPAREMVERRLFRLEESGQAGIENGVWILKRRELLRSAKVMRGIKRVFYR